MKPDACFFCMINFYTLFISFKITKMHVAKLYQLVAGGGSWFWKILFKKKKFFYKTHVACSYSKIIQFLFLAFM